MCPLQTIQKHYVEFGPDCEADKYTLHCLVTLL